MYRALAEANIFLEIILHVNCCSFIWKLNGPLVPEHSLLRKWENGKPDVSWIIQIKEKQRYGFYENELTTYVPKSFLYYAWR